MGSRGGRLLSGDKKTLEDRKMIKPILDGWNVYQTVDDLDPEVFDIIEAS